MGIKFNGIDIYHFNVSFLLLVSFLLNNMDCVALGSSTHFFEMVHLVTSFALIPICQASSQFVGHTTVIQHSP